MRCKGTRVAGDHAEAEQQLGHHTAGRFCGSRYAACPGLIPRWLWSLHHPPALANHTSAREGQIQLRRMDAQVLGAVHASRCGIIEESVKLQTCCVFRNRCKGKKAEAANWVHGRITCACRTRLGLLRSPAIALRTPERELLRCWPSHRRWARGCLAPAAGPEQLEPATWLLAAGPGPGPPARG